MIRFGSVNIVIDERALKQIVNQQMAKELARLGAQIEATAKALLTNDMVNVDSGRLRASTTWRLFDEGGNLGVAVGSGVFYAVIIHEGGTFSVSAHSRRNRRGGGTHRVRSHTRTVTPRPYLVEAARRNGVPL